MLVPVNALKRHIGNLETLLADAATEVIQSGHFVLGPKVSAFEAAFAAYCGVGHCIGVANGTDALELSLKGVGIENGDKVAVTANAAMYGTSAVLACGADPVFLDVNRSTGTLNPGDLAKLLQRGTTIKAVIVTHLYGRLAEIEEISRLCKSHNVRLIEDCAQAHGAMLEDGRKAGSFGDVSAFSFYPTKNLGAIGDGGAVVCRDTQIASRVRDLRQYGWSEKYRNSLAGGRNSRLDEIQAGFLSIMLPRLDQWNEQRRAVANRYSAEIRNPRIFVPEKAGAEYVAHLYVIQSDDRNALKDHLLKQGVLTEVHYPTPDHLQPVFAGRFDALELPETVLTSNTVLTLPCFPELSDAEVDHVISACNAFQ